MVINDSQPAYCVDRAMHILNSRKKAINGAKILVLGVAYKNDIDDYRESPAISVVEELMKVGADIKYYDPFVESFNDKGLQMTGEKELTEELIVNSDLVVITTAHTNVDYEFVAKHADAIFDTKNVMKDIKNRDNIYIL